MRVGGQRAGTIVEFVDTSLDEVLLQFATNDAGLMMVAYHLYDSQGELVQQSMPRRLSDGLCVTTPENEVLLDIPNLPDACISYRLYSRAGRLLAVSDGKRTQIFAYLRIQGAKHPYRATSA